MTSQNMNDEHAKAKRALLRDEVPTAVFQTISAMEALLILVIGVGVGVLFSTWRADYIRQADLAAAVKSCEAKLGPAGRVAYNSETDSLICVRVK